MNMLYVLIPLALMLIAVAGWVLIWAIRSGQFDDLDSQGWSVVLDEDQELGKSEQPRDEQSNGSKAQSVDEHGENSAVADPAGLKHDRP